MPGENHARNQGSPALGRAPGHRGVQGQAPTQAAHAIDPAYSAVRVNGLSMHSGSCARGRG
jgi:hypothetical protein